MKLGTMGCAALVAMMTMAGSAFAVDMVDNPAYLAWAKYKPGTMVKMEMAMVMNMPGMPAGGKNGGTNTSKLLEVTPEKVVVETEAEMNMGGQVNKQPPMKVEILARIEKGKELESTFSTPGAAKPTISDVKEGKDTLEIMGKKVDATTREFTMEMMTQGTTIKSTSKVWYVPEIPGGLAKMVMDVTTPMAMTNTTTVVDFKVEK